MGKIGLKILWYLYRAGSSPAPPTIDFFKENQGFKLKSSISTLFCLFTRASIFYAVVHVLSLIVTCSRSIHGALAQLNIKIFSTMKRPFSLGCPMESGSGSRPSLSSNTLRTRFFSLSMKLSLGGIVLNEFYHVKQHIILIFWHKTMSLPFS